jgi:hypothetical protein
METQLDIMNTIIQTVSHRLISKGHRWIAAGALMAALVACNRPVGPGALGQTAVFDATYSPVYKEFDSKVWQPMAKPSGQTPKQTGSWNSKTKRGSRQISGILELSATYNSVQLLRQVDGYVSQRTTKFHLEDDLPQFLTGKEATTHTLWMYNCGERHGELHVWLFPLPDGNGAAFAVYQIEEPLK